LRYKVLDLIPNKYKEDNLHIKPTDNIYQIPTLKDIKNFLKTSVIDKIRYIKEALDCEDFAELLKCELRKIALGNLTFGTMEVNLYGKDFNGTFGAHALDIVLTQDNKIRIIEPQNDNLIDFGGTIITTKYYKVREVRFWSH